MNMLLKKEQVDWKQLNGFWTASEIRQQPETWNKTIAQIAKEKKAIMDFIARITNCADYDIILTGAGTSEFVGNSVFPFLEKTYDHKVKSYATTDIVADPECYLSKTKPTLLVSYGRSGNSPESVGAVEAANSVCETIQHLMITCNEKGVLSKFAIGKANCLVINLTPETCDQSFAMTSSFSNMVLATLLAFSKDFETLSVEAALTAKMDELFFEQKWELAQEIVDTYDFNRIVYLGSNSLKGFAQESALKICELTGGTVDTVFDSPLGFRHGPKSVINDSTLTIVYLSDDPYTRQYEYDLIREMSEQRKGNKICVLSGGEDAIKKEVDYFLSFDNPQTIPNALLGLEYITFAQTLALFKSLRCHLGPDNPCPSGEVNRVVKGVNIYPYTK